MARDHVTSTIPVDPSVSFRGAEYPATCSLTPRPAHLTGFLRDFLIRHFSASENIEDYDLRKLVWKPTPDTGILIESATRFKPTETQRRPAIIIKRGAYRNQRIGIGERQQPTAADPLYTTSWVGSHTLFCIGLSGPQAEALASEVYRELHQYAQVIARELLLWRFGVVEVGEIAILEEWTEHFVVPVTVGYICQETWTVRQQAPPLKRVTVSVPLGH